ncbi:Lymphocyte antigen 75 [Halotydeus destructor]|nr:Lymphocyte antigen 75 [Halotydeus destructor]
MVNWISGGAILILISLVQHICSEKQDGACPLGWVQYRNDKCFYHSSDSVTYAEAEKVCQKVGTSGLVTLNSDEEEVFVMAMMKKNRKSDGPYGAWLALHRQPLGENSSSWFWTHGAELSFQRWHEDSPSADQDKGCAVTMADPAHYRALWHDVSCSKGQYEVVCERPLVADTFDEEKMAADDPGIQFVTTYTCKPGWTSFGVRCFKLHPSIFTNVAGKSLDFDCWNSYSAFAANITNPYEQQFLEDTIFNQDDATSLNTGDATRPVIISSPKGPYGNWAPGEPNRRLAGQGSCVVLDNEPASRGLWKVVPCKGESEYRLLCSKHGLPEVATVLPTTTTTEATTVPTTEPPTTTELITEATTEEPEAETVAEPEIVPEESIDQESGLPEYQELPLGELAEEQDGEEASSAGFLWLLFVIAIIVILIVIFFALKLRKKADAIALENSKFDSQLYMDKTQPEVAEKAEKDDMVLFDKRKVNQDP